MPTNQPTNDLVGPALQRMVLMGRDETGQYVPIPISEGGLAMSNATNDHSALSGLAANDHPQYALLTAANIFTAAQSMTALKILDVGADHYITFDTASDEATNRNLTIPALGGNDTLATLGVANVFTAVNSFPTGGSASATKLNFGSAGTGFYESGANNSICVAVAGNEALQVQSSNSDLRLSVGYFLTWSSGSPSGATGDVGLARNAIGVLRVTPGSAAGIAGLLGGGTAVASATAMPVPTGRVFHVTGTTTITSITSTNFQSGCVITLIFDGALTFTDGNNLKLAGNFVTTADDTITLVYDGTNWYECCRSVN